MTYTKRNETAMQVLAYFARNPDEELLGPDVALKWGVRPNGVGEMLAPLVAKGLLTCERAIPTMPGRAMVYRAGPKLKKQA